MNIKKIAITALLGMSVVGLTGCGDNPKENYKYETGSYTFDVLVKSKRLTYVETQMLLNYYSDYKDNGYDKTLKGILLSRTNTPKDTQVPFCDVISFLEEEEAEPSRKNIRGSVTKKESVLWQWKLLKGESLRSSCEKLKGENLPSYVNTKDENTVVVSNGDAQEEILSPKVIDEITEAASECFSAKVKMVDIIDDKGYLTKQDYPEIMKLISKCKMHKLKIEVERM